MWMSDGEERERERNMDEKDERIRESVKERNVEWTECEKTVNRT